MTFRLAKFLMPIALTALIPACSSTDAPAGDGVDTAGGGALAGTTTVLPMSGATAQEAAGQGNAAVAGANGVSGGGGVSGASGAGATAAGAAGAAALPEGMAGAAAVTAGAESAGTAGDLTAGSAPMAGGGPEVMAGADTAGGGSDVAGASTAGGSPQAGAGGDSAIDEGAAGSAEPLEPGDCVNNRRDGDETAVDCGGSCPECPNLDYGAPVPGNESRSGCEANGDGFMCAQSMALSPQMKVAAGEDWGADDPPFVYGVVGHDPDSGGVDASGGVYNAACCQCYQLVFRAPMDGSSLPVPKPMIVQGFNTYAGGPSAFDVYMAGGGHGNFNGCTENGTQYQGYPDLGGDWTGGVRATRYSQCSSGEGGFTEGSIASDQCQSFIEGECAKIQSSEPTQSISRQSCELANRPETHYHANWYVAVKRVECPLALTKVTGCRLAGQGLPEADPAITTFDQAIAAGFGERSPNATADQDPLYHTTTMQDCCRPTCAWDANTSNTADGYNRFYTCDDTGVPR